MTDRGEDPRTDAQLVNAINAGDDRAFEALYFRHRDGVIRLARRFTHNDDLAIDVMQETFVYLLGKFPGFRLTARMTTFLYPVVKHLAWTALNKSRRQHTTPDPPEVAADDPAIASRDDLAAAMSALGEDQREVVLMKYVDDMSLDDIAAALGIPLGTVKSRLHNALKILRDDPRAKKYFTG